MAGRMLPRRPVPQSLVAPDYSHFLFLMRLCSYYFRLLMSVMSRVRRLPLPPSGCFWWRVSLCCASCEMAVKDVGHDTSPCRFSPHMSHCESRVGGPVRVMPFLHSVSASSSEPLGSIDRRMISFQVTTQKQIFRFPHWPHPPSLESLQGI